MGMGKKVARVFSIISDGMKIEPTKSTNPKIKTNSCDCAQPFDCLTVNQVIF